MMCLQNDINKNKKFKFRKKSKQGNANKEKYLKAKWKTRKVVFQAICEIERMD